MCDIEAAHHVASPVVRKSMGTFIYRLPLCVGMMMTLFLIPPVTLAQGQSAGAAKLKETKETAIKRHKPHRLIQKPSDQVIYTKETASTPLSRSMSQGTSSEATLPSIKPESLSSTSKDDIAKKSGSTLSSSSTLAVAAPLPAAPAATTGVQAGTSIQPHVSSSAASASSGSSKPGKGRGRSAKQLMTETPDLAQLIAPTIPTSSPTPAPPPPPPPPVPPAIGASPGSLLFSATQGGTAPSPQSLSVSNTGGGTLTWSANDNASWLTLSPASGSGNGTIALTVAAGTLPAGSYTAMVTLTASGASPVSVPVTFTVTAAPVPPAIGMSPTSLSFTAQQGAGNPAAQTLTVSTTGGGTLSWSASDNAAWLSLSPAAGTGNGTVTLNATTGSLTAGSYNAVVTLSGTGVTSKTVPVTFTVTTPPPPPPQPTISLSPTSLTFSATAGGNNPASKTVAVANSGTGTLSLGVTDNASWLTAVQSGNSVVASISMAGLSAGNYSGTITVTASGATNTPQTVPVSLTISSPPANQTATLTWTANNEQDLAGYKIYRSTSSGGYGAPIATLQGYVTSYSATGLHLGTTYFFVITAYDEAGNESGWSNEVSKSIF